MKNLTNNLHFTQEQVTQILGEIASKKEGYTKVLKIALEAIMRAEREIHNMEFNDVSNGYRIRKSFGGGKLLELKIPRSRFGAFYPLILALLKEEEEEALQLAFHLYGAGLTTAQVGEIFQSFFGKHYSTSQISRLFDYAREDVQAWLERTLDSYYPIIYIDATFVSVRRGDSVSKEAFYTILGVKADGTREVLTVFNMPTENLVGWDEAISSLKRRGVKKIGLVVSDNIANIEEVILKYFAEAEIQFCVVHLQRNILKRVKSKEKFQVSKELKDIFRTGDSRYTREEALQRWYKFLDKWGKVYPSLNRMKKNIRYQWYFSYLSYDYRIQSMIYTTNWIERLNRDYKRVTRMRGAFPNPESALLLLGHVAMTRKAYDKKISSLKYETKKFQWDE